MSSKPPYYADLGKKATDIFTKGYQLGVFKLDLKTKSETAEFASGIICNHATNKVFGSLLSKYIVKDHGLSFTERWNTDNTMAADVTIQDKIAEGLKITLEAICPRQIEAKNAKLKTSYVTEPVALNLNLDLFPMPPIADVAVVLKYQDWLAGTHIQFDSQKLEVTKANVALGYQKNDLNLLTYVNNAKTFGGSTYLKIHPQVDCGIMLSLTQTSDSTNVLLDVGAKFAITEEASLYAKVNSKLIVGLGYQHKLIPGVMLTLSGGFDVQNPKVDSLKYGVALEVGP